MKNEMYIIDGNDNYGDSLQLRLSEADTIIFLNYNRFKAFFSAMRRYFTYHHQTRPSMASLCHEKSDYEFAKYILLDYPKHKRKFIFPLIKQYFKGELVLINKEKDYNNFLSRLGVK